MLGKANHRLIGAQNRIKGKGCENHFANCCRAELLCFFRIEDGGRPCRRAPKGFIRKGQVCDFIVSIKGQFWLFDTKTKQKPIRANFIHTFGTKKTSTHKQAEDFIKAYIHGNPRCGFLFENYDEEGSFSFLSGKRLLNLRLSKKGTPVKTIKIRRVSDLTEKIAES